MWSFRRSVIPCLLAATVACGIANGESVEELKKAGDFRGLAAKLNDHRASVRRDAAVALPAIVGEITDGAALAPIIGPLTRAKLTDPWASTREYSGRALMNALQKTKDPRTLNNALQPLFDALDRGQVELDRRRFAATALSVIAMKLDRVDLFRPRFSDLISATFDDPDGGVREYAGRALQHSLHKLDHEPTLIPVVRSLATRLGGKDARARRYSAVRLADVVGKIRDQATLQSLSRQVAPAAAKDPDETVREYAGRALRSIQRELNAKTKADEQAKDKARAKTKTKANTKTKTNDRAESQRAGKPSEKQTQAPKRPREWVAELKDKNPEVRLRAAVALRDALGKVNQEAELKQFLSPLLSATLNDSNEKVREVARLALRNATSKIKDEAALLPVAQAYLEGLKHKDAGVRAHCAHDLPGVVGKITDKAALRRLAIPLTEATLRSASMDADDFPGFALRNALPRLDDQAVLVSVSRLLVKGLKH
ncbi:MAG: hypothetical protein N2C14_28500, partial [Planctomycetales bacterium]